MDHHSFILFLLMFFLMTGRFSHAQQATVTTGVTVSQAAGTISYSAGLIPFNKYTTAAGSITEGMFHIYRIKTAVKTPGIALYNVNIFPNPTPDRINISIEGQSTGNMTAIFYDIKGQPLEKIKLLDHQKKTLSLSHFNAGIYLLKILENGTPVDTYKIIKQ